MKTDHGSFRPGGHRQLLQERVHDAYKSGRKLSGPACCPDCGAIFRRGRWRWEAVPAAAKAALCPACRRTRERLPGASVLLGGDFLSAHRDEILGRVRNCEQAENRSHPLQRIMAIAPAGKGLRITTTDAHLARRIGEALHRAYKGELDYRYNKEDNLLRVRWSR
jgi:hypothetical protein